MTMKARFLISIAALSVWAFAPSTLSQTSSGLGIQTYAGLSITGAVGKVYALEYATDLAATNNWQCLEFVAVTSTNQLWLDTSAPATISHRFYRAVEFDAPTSLVFIPPGTFRMGSPPSEEGRQPNEGTQVAVTIKNGFWMGKCEVTQAEYEQLIGSNPSFFNGLQAANGRDYGTNLTRPVEQVGWSDATNYCFYLTQHERSAGRIPINCIYRLPTETEWEYACRAWTSDRRFSYGDDLEYSRL